MSPYLPITPDQIVENALDAANAGAASVHIHVRNPKNGEPVTDFDLFEEVVGRIREKNKNVIICITSGGSVKMTVEERASVIPRLRPELASMNCGSLNWGLFDIAKKYSQFKYEWEKKFLDDKNIIFVNTFGAIETILNFMGKAGTKPELEVYDVSHLYNIKYLINSGILAGPLYIQFVTGILGSINSTPYDIMYLHETADRLFGTGEYVWSVAAAGKNQFPATTLSLLLGGHVRVGLEDNLYMGKGVRAQNNAEQVAKVARIMKELSLDPATPQEAREILKISSY
jgi:uncharacterized protein (DUF849 family)